MKYDDIQKIYGAGLINDEQRLKIIGHFNLKEEGGKFLAIISIVGAVLVASGIALLIAAHWNEIPRGVKIASRPQLILLLIAFGVWFGFEVNEQDSWIYCGSERQVLLYSLLGLIYLGAGYCLRATRFFEFAGAMEKIGLLLFLIFLFPLTWKDFFGWEAGEPSQAVLPALALVAIFPVGFGIKNLRSLTMQWRWTWFMAILGMLILLACVWFGVWRNDYSSGRPYPRWSESWAYLAATLALFIFCLLQIQVGIQERSAFLVNTGVVFIALDIIAAYFDLFGSMARTGVMFLVSGVFLIVFGVYLERKRRSLMRRIRTSVAKEA